MQKLVFGKGAIEKLVEEVKQIAGKKARIFLVTDKGIEKAGLLEKAKAPLNREEFEIAVFDDITGEPTIGTMRKASTALKEAKSNIVIGIGGGSVLDTAKAASIMATNPEDIAQYFDPAEKKIKQKPLPKILIPTTAGTGSEASPEIVAIDEEENAKTFITDPATIADVAIVDPLMTVTCPPKQTAASGMDALSHAIECFLVSKPTPLTDAYALHAVKLIAENLRKAYHNGDDVEARYNMSIAATLGGLCMVLIPCNIGHCVSEAIGVKYKIPHGIACSLVIPYQTEYNLPVCIERLACLAGYLGADTCGCSVRDAAEKAVDAVKTLIEDIELPKGLKEVNIPRTDIPKLVEYLVNKRQYEYDLPMWNPRKLTMENVTELLEKAWEGS
jgi:alcohol dehydrogenase class IV